MTDYLDLVDRLQGARRLAQLVELATETACAEPADRDAIATALEELCTRIDSVVAELNEMA